MCLEDKVENIELPIMVGTCNCSKYSTFIYIGRQELLDHKDGNKYLNLYNCVKCNTTTTDKTIKKNGGY
jgi:hypothetical protein